MSRTRNLSKLAKNTTTTGTLTQEAGGGGGSYADTSSVMLKNNKTITASVTVDENTGLTSTGPITVAAGAIVTVPATSRWVVL
jgi:hypothetical protein